MTQTTEGTGPGSVERVKSRILNGDVKDSNLSLATIINNVGGTADLENVELIKAPDGNEEGMSGSNLVIKGGEAYTEAGEEDSANGGDVVISGGMQHGDGNSGDVLINGGDSSTNFFNSDGGDVVLRGGDGLGQGDSDGGDVEIRGGDCEVNGSEGDGGDVEIRGGNSVGEDGGDITIKGGNSGSLAHGQTPTTIYVDAGNLNTAPYYGFFANADLTGPLNIYSGGTDSLLTGQSYTFIKSTTSHPFYMSDNGYEGVSSSLISLSGNGSAASGIGGVGQSFTLSFNGFNPSVDTLTYYCTAHSNMVGTLQVVAGEEENNTGGKIDIFAGDGGGPSGRGGDVSIRAGNGHGGQGSVFLNSLVALPVFETQVDHPDPRNGMICYATELNAIIVYVNGAWVTLNTSAIV